MCEHDKEEEDENQLLDLSDALLTTVSAGVNKQIDRIERLLEVENPYQFEIFSIDGLIVQDKSHTANQADEIRDQEGASQVSPRCIFQIVNMKGQVDSIQIDEECEKPQAINSQIKGVPVNVISLIVEVILKGNSERRPDDVEEDDEGEKAVPDSEILRVHVELVPRHLHVRLVHVIIAV